MPPPLARPPARRVRDQWRRVTASRELAEEAVQLLAGRPDLPPENARGLVPLVDGAARGSALRALRGREADLPLLVAGPTPTAAPAHEGWERPRRGNYSLKILVPIHQRPRTLAKLSGTLSKGVHYTYVYFYI